MNTTTGARYKISLVSVGSGDARRAARVDEVSTRLRSQQGFALIEMLVAIVVINVGLLAILLALNSGMVTLRRSAETSTASAIADQQLERFRARAFPAIYLDTTSLAATDSTYQSDAAYSASQVSQACSPLVAACTPSQTVTGPDGRTYRVDTYIVSVGADRRCGGEADHGRRPEARGRPRWRGSSRQRALDF